MASCKWRLRKRTLHFPRESKKSSHPLVERWRARRRFEGFQIHQGHLILYVSISYVRIVTFLEVSWAPWCVYTQSALHVNVLK